MGIFWCLGYECLSGRIWKCWYGIKILNHESTVCWWRLAPYCISKTQKQAEENDCPPLPLKSLVEAGCHFEALDTRKIWAYWGSILCYSMHATQVYGGSCQCIQKPERKVQWGNGHPQKHRKLPLNIKNHFFTERGTGHWHRLLLLRKVVMSSILEDIQKSSGHRPGKLTLGGSAWAVDKVAFRHHFLTQPCTVILWHAGANLLKRQKDD